MFFKVLSSSFKYFYILLGTLESHFLFSGTILSTYRYLKVNYLRNMMIRVDAVLVRAVIPDSILLSIVGIGRGVGVVGGGT